MRASVVHFRPKQSHGCSRDRRTGPLAGHQRRRIFGPCYRAHKRSTTGRLKAIIHSVNSSSSSCGLWVGAACPFLFRVVGVMQYLEGRGRQQKGGVVHESHQRRCHRCGKVRVKLTPFKRDQLMFSVMLPDPAGRKPTACWSVLPLGTPPLKLDC